MERIKIILFGVAALAYMQVGAQDTLKIAQFAGLGSFSRIAVAADTFEAGMAGYLAPESAKVYRADKSALAKGARCIVLTTCMPLDTTEVLYSGRITNYPDTLAIGDYYYLGTTKGSLTNVRPTSGNIQKIGVAIDSHAIDIDIDLINPIGGGDTPTLEEVTAGGNTSNNDIIIRGAGFDILTLMGTDSAAIRFLDTESENTVTVSHEPLTGTRVLYLPDKSGTLATLDDIAGGSRDITNGGNTTGSNVTIGTNDAFGLNLETSSVTITGANGYTQLRLVTKYTPTGSADANGAAGDVAVDDDYIYFKTSAGWKRAALNTF